MCIVVAHSTSAEGSLALRYAIQQARRIGETVRVVGPEPRPPAAVMEQLVGVAWEWRRRRADQDVAESLIAAVPMSSGISDTDPARDALIVIGLRRRTGENRLTLGRSAERVLLEAPCPVLTITAP